MDSCFCRGKREGGAVRVWSSCRVGVVSMQGGHGGSEGLVTMQCGRGSVGAVSMQSGWGRWDHSWNLQSYVHACTVPCSLHEV